MEVVGVAHATAVASQITCLAISHLEVFFVLHRFFKLIEYLERGLEVVLREGAGEGAFLLKLWEAWISVSRLAKRWFVNVEFMAD